MCWQKRVEEENRAAEGHCELGSMDSDDAPTSDVTSESDGRSSSRRHPSSSSPSIPAGCLPFLIFSLCHQDGFCACACACTCVCFPPSLLVPLLGMGELPCVLHALLVSLWHCTLCSLSMHLEHSSLPLVIVSPLPRDMHTPPFACWPPVCDTTVESTVPPCPSACVFCSRIVQRCFLILFFLCVGGVYTSPIVSLPRCMGLSTHTSSIHIHTVL